MGGVYKVTRSWMIVPVILVLLVVAGCRNETQTRIRRSIQDFTNTRMYITLYSLDGSPCSKGSSTAR